MDSNLEKYHPDGIIFHGNLGKPIRAITRNQKELVSLVHANDMVFAVGPAGTGKTYTSIALAVKFLKEKRVKRIILTRPAVEAGENLGFLPGDLKEKLDPYMQPLYDALLDMIPREKLDYYLDKNIVEIAPLAFMRGRTLNDAFVILDEAQNTTHSQMKMFLTRMGITSKFIITGDPGQMDLLSSNSSGLKEALTLFKAIEGIGFVYLDGTDIIRHPVVRRIVRVYESLSYKKK
ncbi:PhoH family protein [Elysia marginata]|uniref:PhoH-like protein n=1 Tax=Elysia marginata TaxID=1093978 RepID=A0AAV4G6H6_9GAST|nr:PhoH family protein [Elysia marginata]